MSPTSRPSRSRARRCCRPRWTEGRTTAGSDPDHLEALRLAGVDPSRAERIGEGWFTVAYRANDLVVRALKPQAEVAGWVERYAHEVALLRLLEARGLPVPADARELRADDGRLRGTATRYLEGASLRDLRLRGSARARLTRELAAFLSELHSTPLDDARATGLPELDLGTELYPSLIDEALPLLGPRSREWLVARFEGYLASGGSADVPRRLLHGDLGDEHVRTNEDGALLGVIDFGDAMIADPAFDAAALHYDLGGGFVDRVLTSYEGPATVDDAFRERARVYADLGHLYLVVFGARLGDERLVAMGRRRFAALAAAETRASR